MGGKDLLDKNMTGQYVFHVQKLETKIERELYSCLYHLHTSFVTIVIRGLGVKVAADL